MMMSLAGTIQGILGTGLPLFINMLMKEYGFRGSLAILAALNLHVLFGSLCLHPVEWHTKKVAKEIRSVPFPREMELLVLSSEPQHDLKDSKKPLWYNKKRPLLFT